MENVTFSYEYQNTSYTAIEDINMSVKHGEFVSIIGPSGCGKSTVLSLLSGLNMPSGGTIVLNGAPLTGTGTDRGVVFQHYSLFPWMTAKQNIVFGIEQVSPVRSKKEREEQADRYLELVGLTDFAEKFPMQLSGGMQQRVAIARAFAMDPEILLMDEPFGALDAKNRLNLQEVLLSLWDGGKDKKTVIFVTHDIDEAILLSDRVIVMSSKPGRVEKEFIVPFARPRDRAGLIKSGEYSKVRNQLVSMFYEDIIDRIGGTEVVL